ncbi:TetR/AcrR family transcriptional regulator [Nodosilinea nodulosa]|uniref:TetR/AcrR family transcriptional regulator n=1 Tax=Nodosilinea nodulosa TaxID=416001 RepID=UPI0002F9789B|nr:TetR/AcrR family transcriptional regulator [Nodosilinea nodulosa]
MDKPLNSLQPRYDVTGRYTALLQAGEVLLCKGYDSAQPQQIAKTAGVSTGLFYRHFKNKQELLTAIMVRHLGILHDQIKQALEPYADPVEDLRQVMELTLRYFQAHEGLIKLFFMQVGYGDAIASEHLQAARQTYRDILASIIQAGIAKGIFIAMDDFDVQLAINGFIGTINWSLYDLLIVKQERIELDALANRLSMFLLRGLGHALG